jgi:hypothetical protein
MGIVLGLRLQLLLILLYLLSAMDLADSSGLSLSKLVYCHGLRGTDL